MCARCCSVLLLPVLSRAVHGANGGLGVVIAFLLRPGSAEVVPTPCELYLWSDPGFFLYLLSLLSLSRQANSGTRPRALIEILSA